jgi:phosphoribosylaminoimidazolecarboxamide formyltransferase/IMP cyclohydrolase
MFKQALVSVSDKSGLVEFLKPLVAKGLKIVSTGGTFKHLKDNGIAVTDISQLTKFPEVMDGRVKTLHPNVHMGLLARDFVPGDLELLKQHGLEPFDLVIVNLYPFEEAFKNRQKLNDAEMIEKIDIGGPSMLRSAAKSFPRICVICDPKDYSWISQKPELTLADRKNLAAKVFAHTSTYDSLVFKFLNPEWGPEFSLGGKQVMELRYGENPQQKASWYSLAGSSEGLHFSEIIQGKALSYNNILDLDASLKLALLFEQPVCVSVKHNNPCGVASDKDFFTAVEKSIKADPVSVFGGIIAVNRQVTGDVAKMLSAIFLECVIAPDYTQEALKVFENKKNLRVLKLKMDSLTASYDFKTVLGGFLLQSADTKWGNTADWDFKNQKIDDSVLSDLVFGEKVCGSLKSNSIAIVKDGQTLGLGMGQVNRVEAVQHAIDRMKTHHGEIKNTVLISDAFFPFPDSIEIAAKAHVKYILQPGGSVKDNEVLAAAERLGITMILSQNRHFRH